MTFDYFVELDKTITTTAEKTDEFTTYYHRLIANGKKQEADKQRSSWGKKNAKIALNEPSVSFWKEIAKPTFDLSPLPPGSWSLQFSFALAKPYLSKDDNPFYIIDNPIVRDRVFRLPMVRPSSWKGNLRSALWQLGYQEDDQIVRRLFGETRGKEEEMGDELGQSGRLIFFPTFFTQTGLEIINPHDRKRRVGKNPILMECVPRDAKGTFSLLYVPFDLIGQPETELKKQAVEDLQRVAAGLPAMFLTYGFSAKRTSGFGVAMEGLKDGFVQIRIEERSALPVPALPPAREAPLPKYLQAPGRLKDEYLNPDGAFRERSQAELEKMTKSQRQEYEKAKKWWEREGKALTEQPAVEPEMPAPQPASRQWPTREIRSFEELMDRAEEIAKLFQAGGEQ